MKKVAFILLVIPILFAGCKSYHHISSASAQSIRVQDVAPDYSLELLIKPYRDSVALKMNTILAHNPVELRKDKPESLLTNWVADALYEQAQKRYSQNVDFAIQNYGGIRVPYLTAGAITIGSIYELMPFDNALVLVKLTGDEILKLANYIAEVDGLPISKQVKMKIENKKLVSFLVNGHPITNDQEYIVAMTDYMANGGDQLSFLLDNERIPLNILVRDALIEEALIQKNITAALDQRIQITP
jgi:2',3'-cyclic-nucleotide 2'-phosphodiesterase (5'-nucleotidase family)